MGENERRVIFSSSSALRAVLRILLGVGGHGFTSPLLTEEASNADKSGSKRLDKSE